MEPLPRLAMTLLSMFYCFATQINLAHGSPTVEEEISAAAGNLTALKTKFASSWVEGPNFRSTSGILWSCIVTLIACIYNAIHLNIPPVHEGIWHFIRRKAKWVGIALLAPELVLFCAYRQFSEARKLVKELNELRGSQDKVDGGRAKTQEASKEPAENARLSQQNLQSSIVDVEKGKIDQAGLPVKKFTLKYGFLVVMGGIIARDIVELTDHVDPPRTLTPTAVLFFARRGVFFDVSSEEILDKSKANVVGKVLICIQVIWFAIQVITRLGAGYPLTLIEVHTVVHVLCALVMYILWWEKPQDISEPLSQSTSDHLDILAVLYVLKAEKPENLRCEASVLRYYGTPDLALQTQDIQTSYEKKDDQSYQVVAIDNRPSIKSTQYWPEDRRRENTVCELVEGQALCSLIGPGSHGSPRYLSAKDVRRWNCLANFLRDSDIQEAVKALYPEHKSLPDADGPHLHDQDKKKTELGVSIWDVLKSTKPQVYDSLVFRQKNFTFMSYGFRREKGIELLYSWHEDPLLLSILAILPIAYGGIHLAAWNFQFASTTESLLWKIGCIDIMATFLAMRVVEGTRNSLSPSIWSGRGMIFAVFTCVSLYVISLLFFLSRLYLLVESFIGLRHVPIGVYATLPWVQNIPHL